MKALVIDRVDHCAFTDVPDQEPGSGEVALDVRHVGLCGSDLNTFCGLNPLVDLPRIPGHEIGGVVASVGPDVGPEIQLGQPVIVIPYTVCGNCPSCRAGRVNACQFNQTLGVQKDGGLRDRLVVAQDRLIANDTLPAHHLALVEPLSVGFHAVGRGGVSQNDTVVVLGGGMIGVGVILGALARGARVLVSEVAEAKHPALLALGVDAVINPLTGDLRTEVTRWTGGAGPDVVIEAVGLPETFRDAVDLVSYSGRVVYVGYAKAEVTYNSSLFNLKELDILGSRNATRDDFDAVIAFLETNAKTAESLISKTFRWAAADQAFDHWQSKRDETFKILIDMGAA